MKRILSALFILALLIGILGCQEKKDGQASPLTGSVEKEDLQQGVEATPVPVLYRSISELVDAVKSAKSGQALSDREEEIDLKTMDVFYAPKEAPASFELLFIEVTPYRVFYYYVPKGIVMDDDSFDPRQGVVFDYCRVDSASEEAVVEMLLDQAGVSPDKDGIIYHSVTNSGCFAIGKRWMSVSVPDHMNTYDTVKPLCEATEVKVI